MTTEMITFEQPVQEHVRACLRLEHLFLQAESTWRSNSIWESRTCIAAIIEILNILDRPDIKPKLNKELSRILTNLSRLATAAHVDKKKLSGTLTELDLSINSLQTMSGKIGQSLRENDFLATVRQHLMNPGGACNFEVPIYHFWLNLPADKRQAQLKAWLDELIHIYAAIRILLKVFRESSTPSKQIAVSGSFQASLDPQIPSQIIQISVHKSAYTYPVVSLGRHGISVSFFDFTVTSRPTQTENDIEFLLTICVS